MIDEQVAVKTIVHSYNVIVRDMPAVAIIIGLAQVYSGSVLVRGYLCSCKLRSCVLTNEMIIPSRDECRSKYLLKK
jgi:hypothetical protein